MGWIVGVRFAGGAYSVIFATMSRLAVDRTSFFCEEYQSVFPGLRWTEHEADHSFVSNTDDKNARNISWLIIHAFVVR
jgi:hypothetical protein